MNQVVCLYLMSLNVIYFVINIKEKYVVFNYRQVSNIKRTWVGNEIVDPSDVIGASPVSAVPTTSSFSAEHLASIYWAGTAARRDDNKLDVGFWRDLY